MLWLAFSLRGRGRFSPRRQIAKFGPRIPCGRLLGKNSPSGRQPAYESVAGDDPTGSNLLSWQRTRADRARNRVTGTPGNIHGLVDGVREPGGFDELEPFGNFGELFGRIQFFALV